MPHDLRGRSDSQVPAASPIPVKVSSKHRVFVVPFCPAIYNTIPGCKAATLPEGDVVIVPHTIETTRFARNMGYQVPSPIMTQYDWAGGEPFEKQMITSSLMVMNPRAFILNQIGTGKTRSALFAIDFLIQQGIIESALVTAPLSTLERTWNLEAFRYFPHLTTTVLHGTKPQRIKLLSQRRDIYIINHDGVETILPELQAAKHIQAICLDELAAYRNGKTARWKVANALCQGRKYVWGMTGAPIPNSPADAYSQVKLLVPTNVPKYYKHFKELTMTQVSNFRWIPKADALDVVYRVMQPACRFRRDEVVELPETSYQTREVPLTAEQSRVYKRLYDTSFHSFQQGAVTALNEGVLMSKLLQVSGGWVYTTDRSVVSLDNSPRIDALLELLDEADGKVIVFVEFIHAVAELYKRLMAAGIQCETVTGETSLKERNRIFGAFQSNGAPRVLVAHPRCMSHGLTLTEADTIIWYVPSMSLETYEQANGRITRPGQTRKTLILHLCGSNVERKLYTKLEKKASVQGALLEMFEGKE